MEKIAPTGNLQIPRDIFLPTSAQSYICGSTRAVKFAVGAHRGMKVSKYAKNAVCISLCSKFTRQYVIHDVLCAIAYCILYSNVLVLYGVCIILRLASIMYDV